MSDSYATGSKNGRTTFVGRVINAFDLPNSVAEIAAEARRLNLLAGTDPAPKNWAEAMNTDPDNLRIAQWAERERLESAALEERKLTVRIQQTWIPSLHFGRLAELRPHTQCDGLFDRLWNILGSGAQYVFFGFEGTGKTQVAVRLLAATCRAGKTARYVVASELWGQFREAMHAGTELKPFRDVCSVDLLVIDEIRACTPYEVEKLSAIVDARYREKRDTILISNGQPDAFRKMIGEFTSARIAERGGFIVFNWGSIRRTVSTG